MTTVISLRHALTIAVTLAVFAGATYFGLPRWLAGILAGLACGLALALPHLISRLRRGRADPAPDRRRLGRELARRLRSFAADREVGDRGVHLVIGCPGAEVSALLAATGFTPELLPAGDGPAWTAWRRGGCLLVELPAACLDERADVTWQAAIDVLPRRLLRRWTRGAVVVTRWDVLETADASAQDRVAELVRDRLRALARHLGLALPVHVVVVSGDDPALAPLLAAPLRIDRARTWGFRLAHGTDPVACERAALAEFSALSATFASRVVEGLGDPEHVPVDMSGEPPQARLLLPLIPRVQRLGAPASRLVAALLGGSPRVHTIWPRAVHLASHTPAVFTDDLFSAGLAADALLVRPHAAAHASRRRWLAAAGLAASAGLVGVGLLALRAYRHNQAVVADVLTATARLPVPAGPSAILPLTALRGAVDRVATLTGWPRPFASLVTATQLRGPLHALYSNAVHQSLYLPTLERARPRLCPARTTPLTDAEVPEFTALLELYTLGTWTEIPGKDNPRTLAEREVEDDPARRGAVVRTGTAAAWSRDSGVSPSVRDQIAELLVGHLPVVVQNKRLHPRREDSCVRQAQQRLKAWRDHACAADGLAALVPGQHTLRELLQSPHADALAKPDDITIPALYTADGLASLQRSFADPTLRCGLGGLAFGVRSDDDRRAAEDRRRVVFEAHATAHIDAWERLLLGLAPAPAPRGCPDLQNLLHRLAASEGPLHKLPEFVTRAALPPPPPAPPAPALLSPAPPAPPVWHAAHDARIRTALAPYVEVGRAAAADDKPPIEDLLVGLSKLRTLVEASPSVDRNAATLRFAEAKTHVENACSLIDPKGASLLHTLVDPVFARAHKCIQDIGPPDPWCAEVAGPFARALGDTYPFRADARRDVQLADLCLFYCPQKGAVWRYYDEHLAAILLAAGNGKFVPNNDPGFQSFRGHNHELIPFYARSWRISNLMFPFGDNPEPALAIRIYAPPIEIPGVEVEEIRLELDGQVVTFTNTRQRWRDLAWPGTGTRSNSGALLRVRGRYHGEPFSEELQNHGAWALFRLLERASSAHWTADHLRFTFTFAALHGLGVDLELDAGIANELLLGRNNVPMAAFRAKDVKPPRTARLSSPPCPF